MTRICIFGTSHLAAVRSAYQGDPKRWAGRDVTLIGGVERQLLDNTIRDGIMTPTSEALKRNFQQLGGVDKVDLTSFDALAMTGCQIGPHMIGYLYGQARWCSLPSLQGKQIPDDFHWQLMSEPAVEAHLRHRIDHVVGGQLGMALRAATDLPIFMVSAPRPSAELMALRRHKLIAQKRAVKNGDGQALSEFYDQIAHDQFATKGITYLPQPPETITRHMLTRPENMTAAVKLTHHGNTSQPDHDIMHANGLYGAAVLDQILSALADMEK